MINYSEKELVVSVQFLGAYHYEKKYRVLVARYPEEEQLAGYLAAWGCPRIWLPNLASGGN